MCKLTITGDKVIMEEGAKGCCKSCEEYKKWSCLIKDIDFAHASVESNPLFFWGGTILAVVLFATTANPVAAAVVFLLGLILFICTRSGGIEVGILPNDGSGTARSGGIATTTPFFIKFKPGPTATTSDICQTIIDAHKRSRAIQQMSGAI